jgi:5S rRNA maturation endonuclease (ribonuclease M5)
MQTLKDWIEKLKKSESLIIVEGKKDREALNKLGIYRVETLDGRPIYKLVEDISLKTKKVIILTDLDKEGKIFYHQIKHNLQKKKILIEDGFRDFLFKKTNISFIESIHKFV